jgi:hypothetical protein
MTIYAFGCSVTHGAELVSPHQDPANTEFSYPNIIAKALDDTCKNFAVCGTSNENIYHRTLDVLKDSIDITMVIVGWTSTVREHWQVDGRDWFFIPSWCATTKDGKYTYTRDWSDQDVKLYPKICADEQHYIDLLPQIYEFFVKYKFDVDQYKRKKINYIDSIRRYCQQREIKLIETCCLDSVPDTFNLDNIGSWRRGRSHPTRDEHEQIAQQILLTL